MTRLLYKLAAKEIPVAERGTSSRKEEQHRTYAGSALLQMQAFTMRWELRWPANKHLMRHLETRTWRRSAIRSQYGL